VATGTIDELDDTDVLTEPAEELQDSEAVAEPTDAASELLAEPVAEAPAEATPQPTATAELPQHVREHYDAIREKEREVRELECVFLDAKREAKDAKEEFELADKSLRDLISRGPDPQRKLPLKDDELSPLPAALPPQPPASPDAWRAAPLIELGLTLKQNELFAEIGVTTIGALEDFRAEIAEGQAAWPKGIGPAKVTDIENRIVDWLDKNRDKFGEAA
jgi:hypothetical protein